MSVDWDRWVTVGDSTHRTVSPRMPDMGWLGESAADRGYDTRRVAMHRRALDADRRALEAEAEALARCDDGKRTAVLNAIHSRLGARCKCEICGK